MNIACLLLGLACTALTGQATAIDGDTIRIGTQSIRLQGVDAPELSENLGPAARDVMAQILAQGIVQCQSDGTHSYNRIVARCYIGRIDIAIPLIAGGWALDCPAYSGGRYRAYELPGARSQITQKGYCR